MRIKSTAHTGLLSSVTLSLQQDTHTCDGHLVAAIMQYLSHSHSDIVDMNTNPLRRAKLHIPVSLLVVVTTSCISPSAAEFIEASHMADS